MRINVKGKIGHEEGREMNLVSKGEDRKQQSCKT